MKTYRVFFINKESTRVYAESSKYVVGAGNEIFLCYYDKDDNIVATFNAKHVIGDINMSTQTGHWINIEEN